METDEITLRAIITELTIKLYQAQQELEDQRRSNSFWFEQAQDYLKQLKTIKKEHEE